MSFKESLNADALLILIIGVLSFLSRMLSVHLILVNCLDWLEGLSWAVT